ncbi:MAG: HPr family phosphocarrier protein [Clostridia bacterium]|nr:HPr family phosphocarrier protein [Clostridia bacterium]MBR6187178.1 HPr family phosphocarrier protein [Clostridia bacterium]
MNIHIHVDSMKAAEHLCSICKEYPVDIQLRSGNYNVDSKSLLGILALMYSARNQMYLDTGSLEKTELSRFLTSISAYLVQTDYADDGEATAALS